MKVMKVSVGRNLCQILIRGYASMPVHITAQTTPNPNAMKFTVDRPVSPGGSRTFNSAAEAAADPLAAKLFTISGVKMVFFLNDFVTVSKEAGGDWGTITPSVEKALQEHFI
ncbi:MAG: NifU N-terminal domain-containing protein [Candidatus Sumerlaeaceae bacterium]|nr:NifU N-terminal domain-containing protein [Candidatus Sumerlaeaceae bacterium]